MYQLFFFFAIHHYTLLCDCLHQILNKNNDNCKYDETQYFISKALQ